MVTNIFGCKKNDKLNIKNYGNENKDIVIFSTNDVLSAYDDNLGYAGLKYYYDNFDRNENYATLVDIGNFSYGNEIAEKTKGKSSIEIMNEMNYDLVVPGTYEFKYGINAFFENMVALGDKVICCNLVNPQTNELYFPPYKIFKYGDTKIAYIGVTSPETVMIIDQQIFLDENGVPIISFFEDETGEALYEQIQNTIDDAKANGADKIVLLAHLGVNGITEKWSSTNIILNTKYVDAVIDGHSMELVDNGLMTNKIGAFIPLVQAGSKLQYIGIMNIMKDGYIFPAIISKNSVKIKDEKITKMIDRYKGNIN